MKLILNNRKRIMSYMMGAVILALGITLSLLSNIGAGAFDALNFSLSKLLNISVGTAMYLTIFVIFSLSMLLKPDYKYVFGFLLSLLTGVFIDMWMGIVIVPSSLVVGIIYFAISLLLLPIGVTFMIQSKMPLSPMDTLMLILVDKIKKPISIMKTALEGSFVMFAILFGTLAGIGLGTISLGTVIITLSIGPLIQFAMKYIPVVE